MTLEKNTRPGIIIISSSSKIAKKVVQGVERNLAGFANTVTWTMGLLDSDGNVLSKLDDLIQSFRFAIIIGTLDDFSKEDASSENYSMLNYEMGFILGSLGLKHVFFLFPEEHSFSIPVDWGDLEILQYNALNFPQSSEFRVLCDQIIKRVRKIAEETSEFDRSLIPEGIKDLEIQYDLHIINKAGDALVRKTITFIIKEGIHNSRKHEIFSDSPQSFKELDLLAYDTHNKSLTINRIFDSDLRKKFSVRFRKVLKKGEQYTYQVQYHWKGLFPKGNSYFKAKLTTSKLHFNIYFPRNWDIWDIIVKIRSTNQDMSFQEINSNDLAEIQIEGLFKGFKIPIPQLSDEMLELELDWDWV